MTITQTMTRIGIRYEASTLPRRRLPLALADTKYARCWTLYLALRDASTVIRYWQENEAQFSDLESQGTQETDSQEPVRHPVFVFALIYTCVKCVIL